MNIENLSDTELELAMLWLYPPSHQIRYTQYSDGSLKGYYHAALQAAFYSYLTDWNLTMPLAFENQLRVDFYKDEETEALSLSALTKGTHANPLRAICLVLVQIALTKA